MVKSVLQGLVITFFLIVISSPLLGRYLNNFIHRDSAINFGRLKVVAL